MTHTRSDQGHNVISLCLKFYRDRNLWSFCFEVCVVGCEFSHQLVMLLHMQVNLRCVCFFLLWCGNKGKPLQKQREVWVGDANLPLCLTLLFVLLRSPERKASDLPRCVVLFSFIFLCSHSVMRKYQIHHTVAQTVAPAISQCSICSP